MTERQRTTLFDLLARLRARRHRVFWDDLISDLRPVLGLQDE